MPASRRCAATLVAGAMLLALPLTALGDESRDALIVETILRIEGFDLAGSTKAQGAVERYLKNNWAGERYLDLVERFELRDEAPGVLRRLGRPAPLVLELLLGRLAPVRAAG